MRSQAIRERVRGAWTARPDGWWLEAETPRLRDIARAMKTDGVRFAALTLRPGKDGLRASWHWDAAGDLLSVVLHLAVGAPLPSIVDLWPGADWAEREARDYYAVSFEGRESTPPLMLREGDAPGVLLGERA